ncbi:MAG: UDP-N-acetylmuramoyl-tripeptide--D-alanyl-D-alanine ligase [bacterium]
MQSWIFLNKRLILIAIFLWLRRFVFQTNTLLHIFQLEGYRNKRFARWLIKNPKRAFDSESFVSGAILFFIGLFLESFNLRAIFLLSWIGVGIWLFKRCKRKKQKKPLVWTARAKRLLVFSIFLIPLIPIYPIIFLAPSFFLLYFLILQIVIQIAGINLILANIFLFPIERGFNLFYLIKARNKMKKLMPMVIGITGSYGKTSIKHIITSIISKKYNTLMTKESYNTLMGVCKVINNELKEEHQIFVVEMGAYKRGEIRKLCKLVRPKIGVLTGIGIQHLERFKTMENIKRAKFEIILSLPPSGIAIVNSDDEVCKGLMNEVKIKKIGYGIKENAKCKMQNMDIMAEDVEVDTSGIKFRVGETMFQTRLLGRHSVSNILAGIAVAKELGIEIEKIKEAILELPFIPHRLQFLKNPNGVFILDDSYNANPIGVDEALSCLSLFKGRKILITPGMIELGEREYEENKKFGEKASRICDIVILIGEKRTKPIFDGLREKGFSEKNIIIVHSLEIAQKELEKIIKPGDCILFENDLPDTYEE